MSPVRIDKIFFQLWKIVVLGALSFFFGMRAWQLIFLTFKWRCTHQHSALVLAGAVSDGSEEQRYYVATPGISQSEVIMWLEDQSEASIMTITILILIISCRDGKIQWKVPIKDAKHCIIRCLYLPFLCWCTRTSDIHYFFSTPFLNLYLKCIYEGFWLLMEIKEDD